jgi:hypothetical protein
LGIYRIMYLEIDTEETAEEYSKRIYKDFQINFSEILNVIPDAGIPFSTLVTSTPEEIYALLSQNADISALMTSYATKLKKSDMVLIAFITDIKANKGHATGVITQTMTESDDEHLIYNFIIVCIMHMKYIFIPEVLCQEMEIRGVNKNE